MQTRFSVIIPAYNAEKTIRRCLDSLLTQIENRLDIEIIVINDGSTDRTGDICEEYKRTNSCLECIHIVQSGVACARNTGLKAAKGKYIVFVDSDDYVRDSFFQMLDHAAEENWDLFVFGTHINKIQRKNKSDHFSFQSMNKIQTARHLSGCLKKQKLNAVYGKVFKNDLINRYNLHFPNGLQIGEDKVFMLSYIIHAETVCSVKKDLYVICVDNNESLSRKRRADLCDSVLKEHRMMASCIDEITDPAIRKLYLRAFGYSFYRSTYTVVKELNKFNISSQEKSIRVKEALRKYNQENIPLQFDLPAMILSIPVRKGMAHIITSVTRIADIFN